MHGVAQQVHIVVPVQIVVQPVGLRIEAAEGQPVVRRPLPEGSVCLLDE